MRLRQAQSFMSAIKAITKVTSMDTSIKVVFHGNSAYTDGHTIVLPELAVSDSLSAEKLKAFEVYCHGYADHEAMHIRYTKRADVPDQQSEPMLFSTWNLVEDVMGEKRSPEDFPGTRRNLIAVDEQLVKDGKNRPASVDDAPYRKVYSWFYNSWRAHYLGCKALEPAAEIDTGLLEVELGAGPMLRLKILRDEIVNVRETRDSVSLARRILATFEDIANEPPQSGAGGGPDDDRDENATQGARSDAGDGQDDDGDHRGTQGTQSGAGGDQDDDGDQSGGEGAQSGAGGDQDDDGDQSGCESTQSGAGGGQDDHGDQSSSASQAVKGAGGSAQQFAQDLLASTPEELPTDRGQVIASMLEDVADAQRQGAAYPITMAHEAKRSRHKSATDFTANVRAHTHAIRSRLWALVEDFREQRTRPARSGRLNTRALHKLYEPDPRLFTQRERRPGIETACLVLVDHSSSMEGSPVRVATESTLAIAAALEGIPGVSVCTAAFPAVVTLTGTSRSDGAVRVLTEFDESVMKTAGSYLDTRLVASTPLAEAMLWAMGRLVTRKEQRRLLIVLTDGVPNGHVQAVAVIRQMIEAARTENLETVGIGIGSNQTDYIRALFDHSQCVDDIEELPRVIFKLVGKSLTYKAA